MKNAPDTSRLDGFVRNTLKNSNEKFTPFDWSEVEVLLRPEPRSISVGISRKNMLIIGGAAGMLVLVFVIFKMVQHYSSLPSEPEPLTDSTQHTFTLTPPAAPAKPDSIAVLKVDSAAILEAQRKKADSLAAIAKADSIAASKKIEAVPGVKIKPDRKKKTDTTKVAADSVNKPDTTRPPMVDTTLRLPAPEIKPEAPVILDTAGKTGPASPAKKKKTKAKKNVPLPAPTEGPVARPDSSKQQ